MTSVSFAPSMVTWCGSYGPKMANNMVEALKPLSLSVRLEPKSRNFIILGSATIPQKDIEALFRKINEHSYYYKFQVLDQTDYLENKVVTLAHVSMYTPYEQQRERDFTEMMTSMANL